MSKESSSGVISNSAIYRRKIKKSVEAAKLLRNLTYIPKGYNQSLSPTATERQREDYNKRKNSYLTISTLHYLADNLNPSVDRRTNQLTSVVNEETLGKDPTVIHI